jgi:prespore-specific regulator
MTIRTDGWSHEEDAILAEVVIKHIMEGSTQLKAFEEVGMRIGRTAGAVGFRWNDKVRKVYTSSIERAKQVRRRVMDDRQKNRRYKSSPVKVQKVPVVKEIARREPTFNLYNVPKSQLETILEVCKQEKSLDTLCDYIKHVIE